MVDEKRAPAGAEALKLISYKWEIDLTCQNSEPWQGLL